MSIRPVLKGTPVQTAVLGGFIHRPAPTDGFAIDIGDTCAFVSVDELTAAVADLRALQRRAPR